MYSVKYIMLECVCMPISMKASNEILQCSLRFYVSFSKHTHGYTYTKKVFKLLHVENELLHRHLILNFVFQPEN